MREPDLSALYPTGAHPAGPYPAGRDADPRPGVSAVVRSTDGWPVPNPVLTVTDLTGRQVARAVGDGAGQVATEALAPGTYTAILTAPGFGPAARMATVGSRGAAPLGALDLARDTTGALPTAGPWTIDPLHSTINLTAHHLGIGGIRGRFTEFHGRITVTEPFERSHVHAEINAASLDTGNAVRDEHLRSDQFLAVEQHPTIEYHSTHLTARGSDRWTVHGHLALHGVQCPVDLDLTYSGTTDDPWGGFRAVADLRRHDFEVSFNERLLSGIAQIGSTVRIELDLQAVAGTTLPWEDLGL